MGDVREVWGIGGGNGLITRRGLVFGTLGLVAAAGLARPAAAAGLGDDLFGGVLGAPPPIGFRLVLKGGEVCRFRRADGLTLPGFHEWEAINTLIGSALSPDDAVLDKLLKHGDPKADGSKTWITKWKKASENEQHKDVHALDEDETSPLTITLGEGTKADPALYSWYEDGNPRLSSPTELTPKLFQHHAGALGMPSAPGPLSVLGSAPVWSPLPPASAQTESPASSDMDLEPTPAVRNPIIFAFRDGKAVARFRLLGATIEELSPAPDLAGASERPVKQLTLAYQKMLVTLRES
jgi:hypothetical protein